MGNEFRVLEGIILTVFRNLSYGYPQNMHYYTYNYHLITQ